MEQIPNILGLCKSLAWMSPEAKACKTRCAQLAERAKAVQQMVESIREKGPRRVPARLSAALCKLAVTLVEGHELVKKCARTHFINFLTCQLKFKDVSDGLREAYPVLAAYLVQPGEGQDKALRYQESDDDVSSSDDSDSDSDDSDDDDDDEFETTLAVYSEELEVDVNGLFYKQVRVYYPE